MMAIPVEMEERQIVRLTLADQVADRLRNWILLGELAPGELLVERTLSERLDVSRTPMREALRTLGNEGLIDMVPNRRPRVANPSLTEILEILVVLTLLEAHGTLLAGSNITDDQLGRLKALLDEMDRSSAKRGELVFFEMDMAFHRSIVEASGNTPLIEAHRHYNTRIYRARFLSTQTYSGRPLMQAQHTAIYEALRRRDGKAAKHHLEEHLSQLGANIRAIFSEDSKKE